MIDSSCSSHWTVRRQLDTIEMCTKRVALYTVVFFGFVLVLGSCANVPTCLNEDNGASMAVGERYKDPNDPCHVCTCEQSNGLPVMSCVSSLCERPICPPNTTVKYSKTECCKTECLKA
ncbi:hypothetical protein MAR_028981 [Mya arenaria]|uniref:VWFC domain-containing protein n=1 Tax=Mya arenaria TaxID=6604 RepID=A0ABY7DI54_MYAAR|nr:hypothetical protein MAR_028981 [Mya arenaria]